jgi:hypothetical protein
MKTIIVLSLLSLLAIPLVGQVAAPPVPPCGSPSRWSYIYPVIQDDCAVKDRIGTALAISESFIDWGDYASTKFYLSQPAYVKATGVHEINPILGPLLKHEPAGFAYTAGTQILSNWGANYAARTGNVWLNRTITAAIVVARGWAVVHNARIYRQWEKEFGGGR